MNFSKRILLLVFVLTFGGILLVSYAHAQTISFENSNATNPTVLGFTNKTSLIPISNSSISFGFSNSTNINPTPLTNSTISKNYSCAHTLSSQMRSIQDLLNPMKGQSIASKDKNVLSKMNGYNYTFDSMYTEWTFDVSKCNNLILKDIGLAYSLHDASGKTIRSITVTEEPSMSKVVNVTESGTRFASSNGVLPNWSGYELGASTFSPTRLPTTAVYEAEAQFNVQSVNQPTDPSGACKTSISSGECDSVIWSGLTDTVQAFNPFGGNLVQGGVEANIAGCNPACTTTYHVWYEALPGILHQCQNVIVTPGDTIVSDVYDDVIHGGTITNNYFMNIVDLNQPGQACLGSATSYAMSKPVFGEFIVERTSNSPLGQGNFDTLPKYNFNPPITGFMWYNGTLNSIFSPYTKGEYNLYTMKNPSQDLPSTTNMSPGSIDSTGTFTDTWLSSKNTCSPPQPGLDWIISSNCAPGYIVNATGNNVIVQGNSVLTITHTSKLLMDFTHKHLKVKAGSGVLIQSGGRLSRN